MLQILRRNENRHHGTMTHLDEGERRSRLGDVGRVVEEVLVCRGVLSGRLSTVCEELDGEDEGLLKRGDEVRDGEFDFREELELTCETGSIISSVRAKRRR